MFPRERVMNSLAKYEVKHDEGEDTDSLRRKLGSFYAERTLTKQPIESSDCAEAIYWLASDRSGKTTEHLIPVDGG